MNTKILRLAVLTGFLALSLNGQARPERCRSDDGSLTGTRCASTISESKLLRFDADPNMFPHGILEGRVVVDHAKRTARLELQPKFFCPANTICADVMPPLFVLNFKITMLGLDFCGSQTIVAESGMLSVENLMEGDFHKMTITNRSLDFCADRAGLSLTGVTLDSVYAGVSGSRKMHSEFEGERFVEVR